MRLLLLTLVLTFFACNQNSQPKNDEKNGRATNEKSIDLTLETAGEKDPIASNKAVVGGTFTTWGSSFPKSLNAWVDYNSFSSEIMGYLFESLVTLHPTKNKPVGVLAEKWEISEDKKSFTFTIHPKATWSDGVPVTATDIQFYFDVMMNKKNKTSLFRVSLSRFERPEVLSEKVVKVTAKEVHWNNFWDAAGLTAFPKHIWEGKNFNKLNFDFPVVSGPYAIKEIKKNRFLTLKRRDYWWGRVKQFNLNKFNFSELKYRFIADQLKTLEMLKKGEIDVYPVYTSKIWNNHLDFESIEKNWIVKQKVFNKEPMGFQGMAFNLRRTKFKDPKVREALCLLLNRDKINEKLMYSAYLMINSYYPDLYEGNVNSAVPVRKFDPITARSLLKKAGWKVNDKGVLEKNGEEFSVNFLMRSPDLRHITVYVEDLKAVGIKATIEQVTGSTFSKKVDEHQFDMLWLAWGASRLRDPEASWHSKTAMEASTNNVPGYQNNVVDSLITLQKTEMNLDRRNGILKEIDAQLYTDMPYALLWNADYHRVLYWNKFGKPKSVMDKYNREDCIATYWWYDRVKDAALKKAKNTGIALPAEPAEVTYTGE
ncbi:MAG: extracellular solute-binding protein [Fibrobacterales bacterium]